VLQSIHSAFCIWDAIFHKFAVEPTGDRTWKWKWSDLKLVLTSHPNKFFVFIPLLLILWSVEKKVQWSRHRPGVAQKVGRGIALLFHDRGTRRRWVVSSTTQPHFTPGKDPVLILQEAGWAPGPVWTGGKSRSHRDSIPDHPARSQSLYRLSYRAHNFIGSIN